MASNRLLEKVLPLHKKAVKGDEKAAVELDQLLERGRSTGSNAPLVDAYHGNTMILIARDKTNPLDKLKWSKAGLKLLDGAVNAEPDNSMIRLLRGKTAYMLPEKHFHRAKTAIEDYTFLINQEQKKEGLLGKYDYLRLRYELGEVYYRIGQNQEAGTCWRELKHASGDPEFLHLLELKLGILEGKPAVEHIPNTDSPTSILLRKTVRAVGNELQQLATQKSKNDHNKING
ncbi:tetratricopeptide repeat protein [Gracilibacillus kekensis]|uniref:Tetratricopeptide repeat-containing protein n=1 Tax=Gracilibacillus kekensis TaxID=1027249 RepID=A0A1M7L930_9BACI|nr:hypothetical protein [Gracilibacillus kekensis]SHM73868.1 hypothetical protein SAMN05216179_0968 [Gracilibacillus kekensis]